MGGGCRIVLAKLNKDKSVEYVVKENKFDPLILPRDAYKLALCNKGIANVSL